MLLESAWLDPDSRISFKSGRSHDCGLYCFLFRMDWQRYLKKVRSLVHNKAPKMAATDAQWFREFKS
jgi:hypothetical protein